MYVYVYMCVRYVLHAVNEDTVLLIEAGEVGQWNGALALLQTHPHIQREKDKDELEKVCELGMGRKVTTRGCTFPRRASILHEMQLCIVRG